MPVMDRLAEAYIGPGATFPTGTCPTGSPSMSKWTGSTA